MNRSTPLRRVALLLGGIGLLTVTACSPVESGDTAGTPADASSSLAPKFGEPADPASLKDGGDLVMALSAEPDALDPTTSRSLYSRYVFNSMCEKLYDLDQDTKIVPQLATDLPTISSDGLTVTIPLRTGVKFADGTPFDAEAVKATLERHLTLPKSGRKSELGPIKKVTAKDPATVEISLEKPFTPLLGALTDRAGMILSPKAIKALGADFSTAPVCVGAMKFAERVPQTSIKVVKDPNYYDADKVKLNSITYRIITDGSIRAANLRSGDVQVADSLSVQDVPTLRTTEGITVLNSTSLGYQGVTFNVGNVDGVGTPAKPVDTPEGKNPAVREAFAHAVDREALVKSVFNGLNAPACSPIPPTSEFASDASNACQEYDPAKAKKMLTDAGVKVPLEITMLASNNADTMRLVQALQAMVAPAGFDLKLQATEYASLLDQQDRGDFRSLQLGWSGRYDPDANITNFVGTGGSQNVAGYNNPTVDGLLEKARVSTDVAERRDLYGQVVTQLHKDNPLVYLYRQSNLTGFTSDITGVQVYPDGVVRIARAGFTK
jgi:peptide/nickel transport system substrate-binding protein